jgi:two-component system, sporulation sensor kinase E
MSNIPIGGEGNEHDKKGTEDIHTAYRISLTERIVRNIAHEIRNPLTNILLGIDQLKNEIEEAPDSAELYFSIIKRNAEKINTLIEELVNAAKKSELDLSEQSLNNLLEDIIKEKEEVISGAKITLKKNLSENIPALKMDKEKIKAALEHIVINAIEAMAEKEGVLEIETIPENDFCVVNIKDTGTGIEPEHIQKLFDPFYRVRSSGHGLGLTFAQNVINNHSGKISVTSVPGKGSIFSIKLKYPGNFNP